MPADWVIIYTTNQVFEADMVKEMLANNEIESVSMNKQDSSYHFGEIEIYVSTSDAFKAAQLISELKGE